GRVGRIGRRRVGGRSAHRLANRELHRIRVRGWFGGDRHGFEGSRGHRTIPTISTSSGVAAVDVGGTFTDCVSLCEGTLTVAKVATTPDQSEAVLIGMRSLLDRTTVAGLFHGTTLATNAILEPRGADTVLITDASFEDLIEIGRPERPSLYHLFVDRPA